MLYETSISQMETHSGTFKVTWPSIGTAQMLLQTYLEGKCICVLEFIYLRMQTSLLGLQINCPNRFRRLKLQLFGTFSTVMLSFICRSTLLHKFDQIESLSLDIPERMLFPLLLFHVLMSSMCSVSGCLNSNTFHEIIIKGLFHLEKSSYVTFY